ncbi:TP53 regulating kinase, partial [Borealophlyctis nickersoniae]
MPFGPVDAIVKERFRKAYRHPVLDERLTARRVVQEARCLHKLRRAGLDTPALYLVDTQNSLIYMECVKGPTVRDYINSGGLGEDQSSNLSQKIGQSLSVMHGLDIVHGDLTTSNMLVREGSNSLVLIDFGLSTTSSMVEDKAVDLYVLERAMISTHPNSQALFEAILKVYGASGTKDGKAVLNKLDEVAGQSPSVFVNGRNQGHSNAKSNDRASDGSKDEVKPAVAGEVNPTGIFIREPDSKEAVYLGVSTFEQSLRQLPIRAEKGVFTLSFVDDTRPHRTYTQQELESLPASPELVRHLVDLYFTHMHPFFPMLNKDSFMKRLNEHKVNGTISSLSFSLLLNALLALVSQYTMRLEGWGVQSSDLHNDFLERAKALLHYNFDFPSLRTIQALILLTLFGFGGRRLAAWTYVGMAVRMAHDILDRNISIATGRPLIINDEDWDTPWPTASGPEDAENVANLIRLVSLCSIIGRICRYSNAVIRPDRRAFLADVQAQLSRWYADLPPNMQIGPGETWGPGTFVCLVYHVTVILFHRVAYNDVDDAQCVASATEMTNILRILPDATGQDRTGGDIRGDRGVGNPRISPQQQSRQSVCIPVFPMVIHGIM